MGDRANIHVKDGKFVDIYLYTHWSGSELPAILQNALRRGRERWTDSAYLTRIIFCDMVGTATQELTGFGISSQVGDGDDRIITVDINAQHITFPLSMSQTFDAYCDSNYIPNWP